MRLRDDDVVIVVSQSGYSTNAIAALDKIRALRIYRGCLNRQCGT